ncbi:MAG: hypothetical protein IPO21_01605 [Bacteroidales bacterium]|nr:hypothetical protein [Bacteroidales bacterium]
MIERFNLSLTYKLLSSFLFFTVLSIGFQLLSSGRIASEHIKEQSIDEYRTLTELKKGEVEKYFEERLNNIDILSYSNEVKNLYTELQSISLLLETRDKDPYNVRNELYIKAYNDHIPYFSKFLITYGLEDLYLINEDNGQVMFSVKKKKDFGANLRYGKYKGTHIADLWKKTIKTKRLICQILLHMNHQIMR